MKKLNVQKILRTLILLASMICMSFNASSQTILTVNDITLLAFNKEQLNVIVRALKENDYNKELIAELETKIGLLDSLNNTYLEIIINKDNQIHIQELIISNQSDNINDMNILNQEQIKQFKNKIKKKNKLITKLIITNVITVSLLIILIL
jgi:hypothetical protein